jgi:predicted ArsR family transcriptional regulator
MMIRVPHARRLAFAVPPAGAVPGRSRGGRFVSTSLSSKISLVPPEPIDFHTHRVLSGVSRVAVLEVLRVSDRPLDVQAIAEQVGLHTNTVRSHLDQLMEAGLVETEVQVRTSPGRPRLLFRAVRTADAKTEDSYKLLAKILASAIRDGEPEPGSVAAEAGRRWGHEIEHRGDVSTDPVDAASAVDRIVALLDDVGFAPTIGDPRSPDSGLGDRDATTVIELHACPFYDVAREQPDVVCAVHLGLIQGALDQMHAPPATLRLEPFVRPELCLVHIAVSSVRTDAVVA